MNKWIKVEDSLPELKPSIYFHTYTKISENVLVFHGIKTIAYLKSDFGNIYWVIADEGYITSGVTHWQYLPEDPVE